MTVLSPEALLPQGPAPRTRELIADSWAVTRRALKAALLDPAVHTVIVMVGVPGSGKSTLARTLDADGVVVFDAVFANAGRRKAIAVQIRTAGRLAVCVWVRTPLEICIQRQLERPVWRRVPADVCRRTALALHREPPNKTREPWSTLKIVSGH